MARARNIKYSFFQNEDLPEIEPLGRLLFIGLWCLADREGRLEDRPKRIKMQLFPCEECDADRYLHELAKYKFVTRYEVDGKRYLQINSFTKHQSPHKAEKPSEIPAPPEEDELKPELIQKFHDKHDTSIDKNDAITEEAPCEHPTDRADSLNPDLLIPDSPNSDCLIPGSGNLKEECGNKKTLSRASASTNVSKTPVVEKESLQAVFEHWKCVMQHPNANLDDKRKRTIRQALQSGYSVDQLCDAIEGCSKTPHNMGHNEQGQRYDGLHVILRDADQIDRFIANCRHPPRPKTKADQLQEANIATAIEWAKGKLEEKNHVH